MDKNNPNPISNPKHQTYTQIKILGRGSFGKAFLVECNLDKSLAVIKSMDIENMSDEERKEALLEAKIQERLDHPNIIKFREVFMAKKPYFTLNIVMDYADGGDLHNRIKAQKGKPFPENLILDWFTQICLALKHIHDKKILHRDLKSQNVFLNKNNIIKLGDFGISKCLEHTLEKVQTIVGTPYYLSPEIVQNKPYSFKSDIWSLGILLYEMTCLKMPFDATSLPLLYVKIIRGGYTPVPNLFSKELKSLIASLLIIDPDKRPSINEILRMQIIKYRIKNFLNENQYDDEFSHTILHKFQVLKNPPASRMNSRLISAKDKNNDLKKQNSDKMSNNNGNNQNNPNEINKKPSEKIIANLLNNQAKGKVQEKPIKNDPMNKNINIESIGSTEATNNSENLNIIKKRETEKKDLKDINDFIKNKKENQQKKSDQGSSNNLSGNLKKNESNSSSGSSNKNVRENNQNQINDKYFIDKGRQSQELQEKKNNSSKISEIKISVNDEKEIIMPKVKIIDVDHNKEKPSIIKNNEKSPNPIQTREPKPISNVHISDNDKDTIEKHKMLIKLYNIEKEVEGEEEAESDATEDIKLKNCDVNACTRDFNFVIDNNESSYELNSESKPNRVESSTSNFETSQIEEIRESLEKQLSLPVFKALYKTLEDNTDPKIMKYDHDLIKSIFLKNYAPIFTKEEVNNGLEKIPEIFSVLLKERQSVYN